MTMNMKCVPAGIIAILAFALISLPRVTGEQRLAKVPRIGILSLASATSTSTFEAFQRGLREFGYIEGENVAIEYCLAAGKVERLAELAAALVRLPVDIIVTEGNAATQMVKDATSKIPIVMGVVGDPIQGGIVTSLARPGGNITGMTLLAPELSAKRVELLKEALPHVARVGVLWNPSNLNAADALRQAVVAGQVLGMQLRPLAVADSEGLRAAFLTMTEEGMEALLTIGDAMFWNHRAQITALALENHLPGVFPERDYADEGGLIAYGPNPAESFRRAAVYVDKILKGANPGDLPITQPATFELVMNLKTAQALTVTLPPSLLFRADELIR
jgi:putative tryptophan/tyrosine transport system substrate-binding protein